MFWSTLPARGETEKHSDGLQPRRDLKARLDREQAQLALNAEVHTLYSG